MWKICSQRDPNASNSSHFTPLHLAAAGVWSGQEDAYAQIVIMLLENGSQVTEKDNRGRSPMEIAMEKGRDKIVRILHSHKGG